MGVKPEKQSQVELLLQRIADAELREEWERLERLVEDRRKPEKTQDSHDD